jgi:hypothetical protein
MGAVYKARQKELDRIVALKILPPDIGKDAAFAERFMREARALAKLNHPGIVTIHDFGRVDGLYFFLMEFVDGVSLQQLLAKSRVLTREALAIVPQICDALQYAHDQGIVHRDIKPENILLDRRGRLKVADFGLAKIIEARGEPIPGQDAPPGACTLTEAGKVVGTLQYMAPEQTEHPSEVDHRADIYALGVVFYQLLTGELPGKPLEPPSRKVSLDVRLDEVVLRALEKEPERRYQQVSEVKTRLETITSTTGGSNAATPQPNASGSSTTNRRGTLLALGVLTGLLALLFWRSFVSGYVLFSNDRPLGLLKAEWMQLPSGWTGRWADLNSLGFNAGSFGETITTLLLWVLGPLGSSKFQAPLTLCLLGMGAWFAFRRLDLARPVALLGAVAVAFNSVFLSNCCWGNTQTVAGLAMNYLSIGLLASAQRADRKPERWAFYALAGLAIGVGVLEAAELGAICGLLVLSYLVYGSLLEEGPVRVKLARTLGRTLVVTAFAAVMAGQVVSAFLRSSLGGDEARQDVQSRVQQWNWATQWSLPKREAAALLIPGLFGYRMDTPGGGQYWGGIGRDPAIDQWLESDRRKPQPPGIMRFVGGGYYLGVPVALVALWAAVRALRKGDAAFTLPERRRLWFWSGLAVVCLLLAFGRFAPFYRWAYALPFFSTVRNPIGFLHPLMLSLSLLFAYGLNGLRRQYLNRAPTDASPLPWRSQFRNWWGQADPFDRRWALGCSAALGLSLVAWLIYTASQPTLESYLRIVGFDRSIAQDIATFSTRQVGWFVVFFLLGVGLFVLVLSGAFTGPRARWGGLLLGLLVVVDLGRANLPWLNYWRYQQKYAADDVIRFLRHQPYEHRVTIVPFRTSQESSLLDALYRVEWAQHQFPYHNIQSLDIVSLPRMPKDLAAFESAFFVQNSHTLGRLARRWQLTNTRYLVGPAASLKSLNDQFDPVQQRFHIVRTFDLVPARQDFASPATSIFGTSRGATLDGLMAVFTNGPCAIFEFTGALPRAKLYANWQVSTNDATTLEQLSGPDFDPERTVLVNRALPLRPAGATVDRIPNSRTDGTVEFVSYAPKEIVLQTKADFASVLLLNGASP